MKKHFKDLFKHNSWANDRLLQTLEENSISAPDILKIYGHIVSAQMVWLLRIKGLPTSPFPLWELYKLRELRTMTEESDRNWLDYMEGHRMDTFEEMIFYKNTQDRKFESTILQIINQVLSHSSYHRGQIARLLRERGIDPPQTDYIFYKRTH